MPRKGRLDADRGRLMELLLVDVNDRARSPSTFTWAGSREMEAAGIRVRETGQGWARGYCWYREREFGRANFFGSARLSRRTAGSIRHNIVEKGVLSSCPGLAPFSTTCGSEWFLRVHCTRYRPNMTQGPVELLC